MYSSLDLEKRVEYEDFFPNTSKIPWVRNGGSQAMWERPGNGPEVPGVQNSVRKGRKEVAPMNGEKNVTQESLIRILQNVLKTDIDLSFLNSLKKADLETLVACVRNRVDSPVK
jgi:hypothetical protein